MYLEVRVLATSSRRPVAHQLYVALVLTRTCAKGGHRNPKFTTLQRNTVNQSTSAACACLARHAAACEL
jgi:hypothetical protein